MGNGRAIAVRAAAEGAAVVCVDRDAGAARRHRRARHRRRRRGARWSSPTSRPRPTAPASSPRPGRPLDGLVLNVGIGRGGGMRGTTADDWDRTFAVNLRSHFLITQAALPVLADGGVDRVHQLRRRAATGEPAARLRRVEGRDHRAVPRRRARGRPPRHPGQRRRTRAHRHPARPVGVARPRVARPHARCRSDARAPRPRSRRSSCSSSRPTRPT